MLESGFKINERDKYVYVKDTSSGYVILCLYVDDMLIISSNDKMIKSTKDMLKSKFDMKDMGLADVILRIKIIRTHKGLVLSQAHYVDKILNTHNAGDSGPARTPIDTSMHLSKNRGVGVAQLEYTSNPSDAHGKAMTRVLHYLRYSRDYGLNYDRYPAVIEGYSNANWISDIKDTRSTSGYIAHSTMYNGKSKHIRRQHNSIRQLLLIGVISIDYVKSKDNITNPLTKGLSRELVSQVKEDEAVDSNIMLYCSIDKQEKNTIGEMEHEFLLALQSLYYEGNAIMSNEKFDNLKEELMWEGSSVVMLSMDTL
ncbi:zinc finger, CCHC-type containing protein [Tanacetum coccineum]